MKKHCRILFATALFLIALVSCKEEALNLTSEAPAWQTQTRAAIEGLNANSMKVLSSTESSLVLELDVNNYAKKAVSIDGKEYFAISASEAHSMLKEGNPDLPEYAYSVVIPPTSACNVRVVDAEYEDISLMVAPSKGGLISSTESNPYTFSEVYEKDAFYPAKLASTDAPFLMRDVRGSVVRLHPFQYNPVTGTLRVYNKMKVEVSFSGTDSRNVLTSPVRHSVDESFEGLFRDLFINYDAMAASSVNNLLPKNNGKDNGMKVPPTTKDMLIICCDSFATDMASFMFHKLYNRGIATRLATMSQVGSTEDDVYDYIQSDYNQHSALTYVLLVGDATRVPTFLREDETMYRDGDSDLSYALLEGNDSIPDIFVGRFCARNRSEVQAMVSRTIYYENNLNQSWQRRCIGIACADTCWYTPNCLSDIEYMDSIRGMLLNSAYGMDGVAQLYDSPTDPSCNPTASDIRSAINQGAFLVNYMGNSDMKNGIYYPWKTGCFTIGEISLLQNDNILPFIYCRGYGLADFSGDFSGDLPPCFAETWLTAHNSVTGAATGAIGVYASSAESCWIEANIAEIAFNRMLKNEAANAFGALCYGSSISMFNQVDTGRKYLILHWTYLGDPSLAVIPNIFYPQI